MSPGATAANRSYAAQPTKATASTTAVTLSARVSRSSMGRHVQDLIVEQGREDHAHDDRDEAGPVALALALLRRQRLAELTLQPAHAQHPHELRDRDEQQGREHDHRKPV